MSERREVEAFREIFFSQIEDGRNLQRERIEHKLKLCKVEYLSIVEAVLDE